MKNAFDRARKNIQEHQFRCELAEKLVFGKGGRG